MRESLALIIAAPLVLVVLAVALDSRLRRGYALGLLAAGALVLDVWGLIRFFQVAQFVNASHMDNLDAALILAVYLLIGLYIALVLTLGAIAETVIARQWRWLAIIAIVSFVPAGISLAPAMGLVPDVFVALDRKSVV